MPTSNPFEQIPKQGDLTLAFRTEGTMINCYLTLRGYEPTNTMFLGCIPRNVARVDKSVFEDFKELMKRILTISLKESLDITPSAFVECAPLDHKGGNA